MGCPQGALRIVVIDSPSAIGLRLLAVTAGGRGYTQIVLTM
jgi:hypothetical protein